MKVILSLCLLLGLACIAHSQTISIKDAETGKPIEMATIMSDQPRAFETTNADGEADFSAFKGSEKIVFRFLGYTAEVKSYSEIEQLNFELLINATSTHIRRYSL